MWDNRCFCDLVRRVRARDEQAATELVARYAPALRVAVRVRLTDVRLRRVLDEEDICQSVLADFFDRATAGQFKLERPEQLRRLLTVMARNRVTNRAIEQRAARRDQRRERYGTSEAFLVDPSPTPSEKVEREDLLHVIRRHLSQEEQELIEQRARGQSWAEMAAAVGTSADALRIRFQRSMRRVVHALGVS